MKKFEKQKFNSLYGIQMQEKLEKRLENIKEALKYSINSDCDKTHIILKKEDTKLLYNELNKKEYYKKELIKANNVIKNLKDIINNYWYDKEE
jgi:hypothetical protein